MEHQEIALDFLIDRDQIDRNTKSHSSGYKREQLRMTEGFKRLKEIVPTFTEIPPGGILADDV